MAEAGIGVDIVEIARMSRVLEKTPSFARKMFTEEEQRYCDQAPRRAAHYAARFAAREAVLKALGTGFAKGVGRKDVSVSRDDHGKPVAVLQGKALQIAQEQEIVEVALSLSLTSDLAVANAMAISDDARPRPKQQREDERARVARSFREARSILDELERVQEESLASLTGETLIEHGGSDETHSEL